MGKLYLNFSRKRVRISKPHSQEWGFLFINIAQYINWLDYLIWDEEVEVSYTSCATVWLAYSVMYLTVNERNRVRVPATPNNIVPCCNDSNTDFGSVSVGLNPTGTSIFSQGVRKINFAPPLLLSCCLMF